MASLGHSGYGIFLVGATYFLVAPTRVVALKDEEVGEELYLYLENAEEEMNWVDHKINRSILIYGTS